MRTRRRRRGRRAATAVAVLLVAGLLGGYAYLDVRDHVPGVLTDDAPWPDADPFPTASAAPAPTVAEVVGPASTDAPVPTAAALEALTAPVLADPRTGPDPGVLVADVTTGEDLYATSADALFVPASSLKLLTGVAAVETLGDRHTFTTSVVDGADGQVVLVAGGDLMLAADAGDPGAVLGHAGLGDLADQVASALAAAGRTSVRVALDDTIFTGPQLAPNWGEADLAGGWAMPIVPLAVDVGVVEGETRRHSDASLAAAHTFAAALAARGIAVEGDVVRADAPESAAPLGAVESAPLREVVAYTMQHSENVLTEVLGRMTALARGGEGSFAGAGAAVLDSLAGLGLDVTGAQLHDVSGLSSMSRLSPRLLVDALLLATDGEHPELLSVVHSLPVAALEGTLADRLHDTDAAGLLTAKTGTLPQAAALTGLVTTADGRLLAFAFVANGFDRGAAYQARLGIDGWAASLAACGCS